MQRVAVVSDVHGNLTAYRAVLDDIAARGIGDVSLHNGPDDLRSTGHFQAGFLAPELGSDLVAPQRWTIRGSERDVFLTSDMGPLDDWQAPLDADPVAGVSVSGITMAQVEAFTDMVLSYDLAAATATAEIGADAVNSGHPMSLADAQIAGICLTRGATLATRNTKDFQRVADLSLVNPFRAPS